MNAEAAILAQLDAKGFVPLPHIDPFPKKTVWQERIVKALPAPVEKVVKKPVVQHTAFASIISLSEATDNHSEFQGKTMTMERIGAAVANVTGIPALQIRSHRRFAPITRALFMVCYLCRELTDKSYTTIGRWLNRDHTSVLHAMRTVDKNRAAFEPELSAVMRRLGVLA